ncbi:hypothetical protein BX070DRAFT_233919 [Coemansia spiralis]|nr:hypothetical protein BX070DRAFT_233919 [Coemansia spiralis]
MDTTNTTTSIKYGSFDIRVPFASKFADDIKGLVDGFADGLDFSTKIETFAAFLDHCAKHKPSVAPAVLNGFGQHFGVHPGNKSIHTVVSRHKLSDTGAYCVLRAYYALWNNPSAKDHYFRQGLGEKHTLPAFFLLNSASVMALFGG